LSIRMLKFICAFHVKENTRTMASYQKVKTLPATICSVFVHGTSYL
jgi:hypothetical protein